MKPVTTTEWTDNVIRRQEWERRTGGKITLDQTGPYPRLWRAFDKRKQPLKKNHDLGWLLDALDG